MNILFRFPFLFSLLSALIHVAQLQDTDQCFFRISTSAVAIPSKPAAGNIEVQNNCPYTVWAAAVPRGGKRLDQGQSWTLDTALTTPRIWGRTKCNFDIAGRGTCETGDCNGLLQCTTSGTSPITTAEFSLNQVNNRDFYDISLVNGFNIPIAVNSTSLGCRSIQCTADINEQCPNELRTAGGCHNPCTVFKTSEYCCTSSNSTKCGATNFSRFFKVRCRDAYSYPLDNAKSTFTCETGADYRVVFCP